MVLVLAGRSRRFSHYHVSLSKTLQDDVYFSIIHGDNAFLRSRCTLFHPLSSRSKVRALYCHNDTFYLIVPYNVSPR